MYEPFSVFLTVPFFTASAVRSKLKGSERFALLTIGQQNGTVTVALAVKNGTVKKTENGSDPPIVFHSMSLVEKWQEEINYYEKVLKNYYYQKKYYSIFKLPFNYLFEKR